MSSSIPRSHPRYNSLVTRERIAMGMKQGLVHSTGLIAHGRGEAFDYLLGEQTQPFADQALQVAAALLIRAEHPVLSVNGNVVALTPQECVDLANQVPLTLEVNLFHRTSERINLLVQQLKEHGAAEVLGQKGDANIPGLDHDRGICERQGIYQADVVLVPLEDGDRCQALKNMGKTVIVIDLNPLSRTSSTASVTIVDNITRALPRLLQLVEQSKQYSPTQLEKLSKQWDNKRVLKESLQFIAKRINSL